MFKFLSNFKERVQLALENARLQKELNEYKKRCTPEEISQMDAEMKKYREKIEAMPENERSEYLRKRQEQMLSKDYSERD